MEETYRKLEEALDYLCCEAFGNDNGVEVSGELYNMIFEENFDLVDVISFLSYCRKCRVENKVPKFDKWFNSNKK